VILSKFWSRYDLQNFRKRIFWVTTTSDSGGSEEEAEEEDCGLERSWLGLLLWWLGWLLREAHANKRRSRTAEEFTQELLH
jgi:hypothetical protein